MGAHVSLTFREMWRTLMSFANSGETSVLLLAAEEKAAGLNTWRLLPRQGLAGKIEMQAASLEGGDAHDAVDSRERICGGRRQQQDRYLAITFAEDDVGHYGLFDSHASAHGCVFNAAGRA
jgi:hypothetical protein